jgi:hypothetical protein
MTPVTGSGKDDTAAIQAEIDQQSLPTNQSCQGSVRFGGTAKFRISSTLKVGQAGQRCVSLLADHAVLDWIGPKTDAPMIEYRGEGKTAAVRMSGLFLRCNGLCRGIAAYHQVYGGVFSQLFVQGARQVAIDMIGCWGSSVVNSQIIDGHGIALRLDGHNTACVDGLRLHSSADDWPDPQDATVTAWDGTQVQTPVGERALVVVTRTNQLYGRGWCIEGVHFPGLPLINYVGRDLRLDTIRVEGCTYGCLHKLSGPNNEITNLITGT